MQETQEKLSAIKLQTISFDALKCQKDSSLVKSPDPENRTDEAFDTKPLKLVTMAFYFQATKPNTRAAWSVLEGLPDVGNPVASRLEGSFGRLTTEVRKLVSGFSTFGLHMVLALMVVCVPAANIA